MFHQSINKDEITHYAQVDPIAVTMPYLFAPDSPSLSSFYTRSGTSLMLPWDHSDH